MCVYRVRVAAVLLMANVAFISSAMGQKANSTEPTPQTAEAAQRWLEVFNSGDFQAMEQFQGATATSDPEADEALLRQYEMYLVTRGVDVSSMKAEGVNRLTLVGQERLSGDQVNIILDMSGDVPRIGGTRLARTPDAQSESSSLSEAKMIELLDQQITHRSGVDEFSGAVLLAKDGETIFKKAWGVANKATGAPNQVDTKFNLASMGKMFTAVAVLQLAQAGKLSLDDPVGRHLPDYKKEDVREKVTIRHLLTHTSGMGDIFTKEFEERRTEIRTVADWVSLFETAPLSFEPGTRWRYSNAGFCLLGAIIEKVSGENYYDYLDEHIFRPAGMKNTGAFETDRPVENLAIGYTRMGAASPEQVRERVDNTDLHSVKGSPAGGSYSTVEDMAKFATALLDHKLINEEYTQLAMTIQPKVGRNADDYGLGFQVENDNGHTIVGHGGGFPGISSAFYMYPDDGYVIIIFSNYDMVARRFEIQLRDWILSQPVRQPN